jgi:hypothetical protein
MTGVRIVGTLGLLLASAGLLLASYIEEPTDSCYQKEVNCYIPGNLTEQTCYRQYKYSHVLCSAVLCIPVRSQLKGTTPRDFCLWFFIRQLLMVKNRKG